MSERELSVRARRLGPAFDLLAAYHPAGAFFEHAGTGLAASGELFRVDGGTGPERIVRLARAVTEALRKIHRDPGAPPPLAVASIPFADDGSATAVIFSRVAVRREPGETWRLDISPGGIEILHDERERWTGRAVPHDAFEQIRVRPEPEPEEYAEAVARATKAIARGDLRKVVLARTVLVNAGRDLDAKQLAWRLRAVDPSCYVFAVPQPSPAGASVLVGATPELLVRRRDRLVEAMPLAGSSPRYGDPSRDRASADALFRSAKDREEHAVVVEDVARVLRAFCDRVEHPHEPELLGTANVWHLATPFRGRLHDPNVTALDLVAALHPTPAVCGTPREAAREALDALEPIDRGGYAGPVGWMDADGDGEWAIALRCAEITGSTARLFAGAGIVADSVPEAEVDETERKFRALLDALRWG